MRLPPPGYPSFIPRLPRYRNAYAEVVQGMKSLVIYVTCNNEIEEFLEQKGNILHVLFNQLNGSEP